MEKKRDAAPPCELYSRIGRTRLGFSSRDERPTVAQFHLTLGCDMVFSPILALTETLLKWRQDSLIAHLKGYGFAVSCSFAFLFVSPLKRACTVISVCTSCAGDSVEPQHLSKHLLGLFHWAYMSQGKWVFGLGSLLGLLLDLAHLNQPILTSV